MPARNRISCGRSLPSFPCSWRRLLQWPAAKSSACRPCSSEPPPAASWLWQSLAGEHGRPWPRALPGRPSVETETPRRPPGRKSRCRCSFATRAVPGKRWPPQAKRTQGDDAIHLHTCTPKINDVWQNAADASGPSPFRRKCVPLVVESLRNAPQVASCLSRLMYSNTASRLPGLVADCKKMRKNRRRPGMQFGFGTPRPLRKSASCQWMLHAS